MFLFCQYLTNCSRLPHWSVQEHAHQRAQVLVWSEGRQALQEPHACSQLLHLTTSPGPKRGEQVLQPRLHYGGTTAHRGAALELEQGQLRGRGHCVMICQHSFGHTVEPHYSEHLSIANTKKSNSSTCNCEIGNSLKIFSPHNVISNWFH